MISIAQYCINIIFYQEELVMTTDPTLENEDNVAALNSIFKVLKSFPAVPEDHFVDNGV